MIEIWIACTFDLQSKNLVFKSIESKADQFLFSVVVVQMWCENTFYHE